MPWLLHNKDLFLKNKSGFTLIELILAILLTALIAYNVVPRFFNTVVFAQNLFVQQVTGTLLYAQNLAMGSGCHISIATTTTTLKLQLRSGCTTGTFSTNSVQDPSNVGIWYTRTVPTGVTITSTNFPMYFDNNGQGRLVSSNNTVNSTITVVRSGLSTIVNVKGNTGYIGP